MEGITSNTFIEIFKKSFPNQKKCEVVLGKACDGLLSLEILIVSDDFNDVKLLDRHKYI